MPPRRSRILGKRAVRVEWRGTEVTEIVRNILEKNSFKAAIFLQGKARELVGRNQPAWVRASGLRGLEPSAVGTPPKIVTGTLQRNIIGSSRGTRITLGIRKGSPAEAYALRLEKGFVGIDSRGRAYSQGPRPFLVPTIIDHGAEAARIAIEGK